MTWINPVKADGENINPGMGVAFQNLAAEDREQVISASFHLVKLAAGFIMGNLSPRDEVPR